nr:MAG TPA: hypothetical protein [Caudoviricetes sp.]
MPIVAVFPIDCNRQYLFSARPIFTFWGIGGYFSPNTPPKMPSQMLAVHSRSVNSPIPSHIAKKPSFNAKTATTPIKPYREKIPLFSDKLQKIPFHR